MPNSLYGIKEYNVDCKFDKVRTADTAANVFYTWLTHSPCLVQLAVVSETSSASVTHTHRWWEAALLYSLMLPFFLHPVGYCSSLCVQRVRNNGEGEWRRGWLSVWRLGGPSLPDSCVREGRSGSSSAWDSDCPSTSAADSWQDWEPRQQV